MKFFNFLSIAAAIVFFAACSNPKSKENSQKLIHFADPFIGTAATGHTFPAAALPFGLIQIGSDTGTTSWDYCSGYNYRDSTVRGFSHTHLNGTGCSDLGDILILPFDSKNYPENFRAAIDKASERAYPAFYAVNLSDFDINAKFTATHHTAFHSYTFNKAENPRFLIDFQSGTVWNDRGLQSRVLESEISLVDSRTIVGHQKVHEWVTRDYFFVMEFDKDFAVIDTLPMLENNKAPKIVLSFELKPKETVQIKLALSSASLEGAKLSMKTENPDWDFDKVLAQGEQIWENLFNRVQIEGTDQQKRSFYTSMYHLLLQPANIADLNGDYIGPDDQLHNSKTKEYYSTFSLWDTYRAAHPLFTLLFPEKVPAFVESMIQHQKQVGILPIWALWGKENYCMIGNHAVPVVVDAYLKGFPIDVDAAYTACFESLTKSHLNSNWELYERFGYYPFDSIPDESVSRTLESVYDDYCFAQFAKKLGKDSVASRFFARADYYKNLFCHEYKMMRGRDSKGSWRFPFNPLQQAHAQSVGGDYTEGNSWQYTWHVQHNVQNLMDLMGGADKFCEKLDTLFYLNAHDSITGGLADVTGLIGQYAHGNEPSHHVTYLYSLAGKPFKTQELVRQVFDRYYLDKPDGLCGNDDCGQMSAWYIFSALGFYPVNPCGGEYVFGAPQLPKASISLESGKVFTVIAENLSDVNKYVSKITLNDVEITGNTIQHSEIIKGGTLKFVMTDTPSK